MWSVVVLWLAFGVLGFCSSCDMFDEKRRYERRLKRIESREETEGQTERKLVALH